MTLNEGDTVMIALSDGLRRVGVVRILFRADIGKVMAVESGNDMFIPPEVKVLGRVSKEGKLIECS